MDGLSFFFAPQVLVNDQFEGVGYFFCYCKKGELQFSFLNTPFSFSEGDVLIIKNHSRNFSIDAISAEFDLVGVFVSRARLVSMGIGKYAMDIGRKVSLFFHPVIKMSPKRSQAVLQSFDNLQMRLNAKGSFHYEEAVGLAFSRLVLDISEGQLERYITQEDPDANEKMFRRFLLLLDDGHYKRHREVAWYADQLCVTPKHLSHCVKMAGGQSVKYWIDGACLQSLVEDLKEKSAVEVCKEYDFSSLSYLSRYVKRLLGISPREIK